jgi:hypothetical protein
MESERLKLDRKMEQLLQNISTLSKSDQKVLLRPFKLMVWKVQFKKALFIVVILSSVIWSVQNIEVVNWNLSAIGRLFLMQLLPFWDWTYLYNEKCLVKVNSPPRDDQAFDSIRDEDCSACEHLVYVDVTTNVTFADLSEKYLLRGQPVIVSDTNSSLPEDVVEFVLGHEKILRPEPCQMRTNLLLTQYGDGKLRLIFEILQKMEESDSYFLHFRICDFGALKESRLLIKRPYFYAKNLEPPSSSWLLMSQNYQELKEPKDLHFKGLIMLLQVEHDLHVELRSDTNCDQCPILRLVVKEGETLVFSTDIWKFSYFPSEGEATITFVTETNWNP